MERQINTVKGQGSTTCTTTRMFLSPQDGGPRAAEVGLYPLPELETPHRNAAYPQTDVSADILAILQQ